MEHSAAIADEGTKKPRPIPSSEFSRGQFRWSSRSRSVANDRASEMRDHDFDAVVTAWELVGQNFATEDSFSPSGQARSYSRTARGNACRNFVLAAIAGIFDTPGDADRRRWRAANWSRSTACGGGAKAAGFGGSRGSERKHGSSHAARDQSTQRIHRFLSCWKVEYQRLVLVSLANADRATGRVGSGRNEFCPVPLRPK